MPNIETVASIFAFNWMTPWRCQSLTKGPKTLWLSNHWWNRFELLEKQNADKSTNGVVGNKGKTIPNTPSARLIQPTIKYPSFL